MNKISSATVTRTILLAIALINQLFVATGHSMIGIPDETVNEFVSAAFTIFTAVVAWWKNNSFTKSAIAADEYMKDLKDTIKEGKTK